MPELPDGDFMTADQDHRITRLEEPAAGLSGRPRDLLRLVADPSVRAIAGAFLLKAAVIAMNFALVMLAARVLDTERFGLFSILFSAAGLLAVIATFGQQVSVMRSWNEYVAADDPALLKGALRFSAAGCLIGCALVAIAFYAWAAWVYPAALALAVTAFLVTQACALTTAHLVRTAVGVGLGDGIGVVFVILPAIVYLSFRAATGTLAGLDTIFLLFAAGALTASLLHLVFIRRRLVAHFADRLDVRPRFDSRAWLVRSARLWVSNGLEAANQYLDVLIIGYLMNPAVAGAYFVTTRLANAFAAASDAMHLFSTRRIPNLYFHRRMAALDAVLDTIALVTLAVVVAGMGLIVVGGEWILVFFNADYADYYLPLVLLCFGTAAVAAAGPSGPLLMLTGHEARYLTIISASVALRAIGFFALIPAFGIMGAVSASAISFIVLAGALRHASKRLTGIDGSIVRLVGLRGRPVISAEAK